MSYLTGEIPAVGDTVEHYRSGGRGVVQEVEGGRPHANLSVDWGAPLGRWYNFPSELSLIRRHDPVEYLRTDHYGHEMRPQFGEDAFGQPVPIADPEDTDWWRPLIVVVTYAPLSAHPPLK